MAGLLEYVGLTVAGAGVLAGAFTGFPGQVSAGISTAVCQVLGEEPCGGRPGTEAPAGPPPRPCNLSEDRTVRVTDLQFMLHSDRSQATNVVARRSDGSLQETFTIDSKSGFAPQAEYGPKSGKAKGANITAGGGVLSGDVDTVTVDFETEQQRQQYHRALTEEVGRLIRTKGLPGFNDEATPEFEKLEENVARAQGLKFSTYHANGRTAYGKAEVSLGEAPKNESGAGVTAGLTLGGMVENGGESGVSVEHVPGQWPGKTTETRKTAMTLGWDARAGATITLPGVEAVAKAGVGGQSVDGSTISIERDANGDPVRATFSTSEQSQFDVSGKGSITVGRGTGEGERRLAADGEQTTRDIEVDLTNDPRGARVAEAMMELSRTLQEGTYPGGPEALARDYDALVRSKGQIFTAVHDRIPGAGKSPDGWSVTPGVKVAGAESSEERSQLRLRDAYIEDPRTGQRRPWERCTP